MRADFPGQTIVLSSGDNYVRGPRFFAAADVANDPLLGVSGDGRADIALLNAMGFQASAIGNHELDLGTAAFASIIAPEVAEVAEGGAYPGAAFPYLAANLRLTDDEALRPLVVGDGLTAPFAPGSLAGSAVVSVGDERIGVVGATTPHLARITSVGGITVEPTGGDATDALAAVIQRAVDELLGQGIDKVILLAHMQQIAVEEALAGLLSGVDVIVAGARTRSSPTRATGCGPATRPPATTRSASPPPPASRCCSSTPTLTTATSGGSWSASTSTAWCSPRASMPRSAALTRPTPRACVQWLGAPSTR